MSDTDLDFTQIWQNTIATLDADGLPARERAFLTLARLAGLLDGTALVKVPNDYTKDVVETRVRDEVTAALSDQLGTAVQLAIPYPAMRRLGRLSGAGCDLPAGLAGREGSAPRLGGR